MRATSGNAVQVRTPAIRALEVKTQQEPHGGYKEVNRFDEGEYVPPLSYRLRCT